MSPTPIMVPMMLIPMGRRTSRLLDKVVLMGANISAVIMARFLSDKCDKYDKCGKTATYTVSRGARANR